MSDSQAGYLSQACVAAGLNLAFDDEALHKQLQESSNHPFGSQTNIFIL